MKSIAVLGATGNQGSGVVEALLNKTTPAFRVLAVTRDVSSPSAKALQRKYKNNERFQLVTANIYSKPSLISAFAGVYGVFAVTHNRIAGKRIEKEADLAHELEAGRNIIEAVKASKIQHFVMSSLPNLSEASQGKFTKVAHFDHKAQIEQWARRDLEAVTALHPGLFYTNMQWPQYCQRQADGSVKFCAPVDGNKLADWVDPGYDIGIYAAEIFSLGPEKTAGKTYPVVGPKLTFAEFARIYQEVAQQKAVFDPISLDEWGATVAASVGKGYEEDIRQMMEWIAVAPDDKICYGTTDKEDDRSWEDLEVKGSSFVDWMRRSAWNGP